MGQKDYLRKTPHYQKMWSPKTNNNVHRKGFKWNVFCKNVVPTAAVFKSKKYKQFSFWKLSFELKQKSKCLRNAESYFVKFTSACSLCLSAYFSLKLSEGTPLTYSLQFFQSRFYITLLILLHGLQHAWDTGLICSIQTNIGQQNLSIAKYYNIPWS